MRIRLRLLSALAFLLTAHAASSRGEAPPSDAFLVKPYLQWGDAPTGGGLRLLWHADDADADWAVEIRDGERAGWWRAEGIESTRVDVAGVAPHRILRAKLQPLTPGGAFAYRVRKGGAVVFEAEGRAPKGAGQAYRFVAFGDSGADTLEQKQVAYQAYLARPDFVVITGDMVYDRGRVSEYRKRWWPIYNADEPSPGSGAPLHRSTVFLAAPGNHDIANRSLETYPDGLAYFYLWDQPRNGPIGEEGGPFVAALKGPRANIDAFRAAAGSAFPRMANFSFDYGNAHWTVLDANPYVDWTDKALRAWVEADLAAAKGATWRFVAFHQPGFNSSVKHFEEQQMRRAAVLFEAGGVDLVFSGHVHNYQRSHPLRFAVDARETDIKKRTVDGAWTLDKTFDGATDTTPDGVIYLITGAGGNHLYNPEQQDKPESWQAFTSKFLSKVNSFTVVDVDGPRLTVKQLAADGRELDRFIVSKPAPAARRN